ncbi:hypothetical protein IAE57_13330 [Stenotrophomonas sp. S48]|uniref:hypothetical protein n=1 Tax=unclassified Stenotrophomonas TaxID=196198 RepID=UPI001900D1FC|nr:MULTISPECIES: hypothetical protein [unclassified Stenotrophomonas]MBK0027149.1 hypothetical protein [Stenotrophomonas sp. S48]MBK0049211.1 hypothetical protein [Stenotrophomonas sp. S49]
MKPALIIALLGLAIAANAAGPAAPEAGWSKDPVSGCQFVPPRSLPGPFYWIGACPGGKADGRGVLRRRNGAEAGEVFYGELKDGVPVIGVIDTARGKQGGLIAGRWKDGDLTTGEDSVWQDNANAFTAARKAAQAASAVFKAQNNEASARYYAQQAKMLDEQVDR